MDFDLLLSLAGVFFPSAIQGSTGYAEAGSKQQREPKQHLIAVACLGRTGRTGSRPNSIVGIVGVVGVVGVAAEKRLSCASWAVLRPPIPVRSSLTEKTSILFRQTKDS